MFSILLLKHFSAVPRAVKLSEVSRFVVRFAASFLGHIASQRKILLDFEFVCFVLIFFSLISLKGKFRTTLFSILIWFGVFVVVFVSFSFVLSKRENLNIISRRPQRN